MPEGPAVIYSGDYYRQDAENARYIEARELRFRTAPLPEFASEPMPSVRLQKTPRAELHDLGLRKIQKPVSTN
jgi:hypothetical protein